jgi:hypothetical protein
LSHTKKVGTHLAKLFLSLIGFGFSDCDTKRGGESIEHQRIRRPLFYFARSIMTKHLDLATPALKIFARDLGSFSVTKIFLKKMCNLARLSLYSWCDCLVLGFPAVTQKGAVSRSSIKGLAALFLDFFEIVLCAALSHHGGAAWRWMCRFLFSHCFVF